MVLEFLGLHREASYYEKELEGAIIMEIVLFMKAFPLIWIEHDACAYVLLLIVISYSYLYRRFLCGGCGFSSVIH